MKHKFFRSSANIWRFFAWVYGLTTVLSMPILISGVGMSSPINMALMAMITCLPSALGVVFVYRTRSPQERLDFWRRVFRWPRKHTKSALLGIFILPLNVFLAFGFSSLWNGSQTSFSYAARVLTDWRTLLVFLVVELVFGAISEELGWRGYALDELQKRWNPLSSSLVLGLVWAIWHTPAFLIPGTSQYAMGGLFSWKYLFFMAMVILGSIIHTWAYNNTGRSILVAGILMHFSQNAALIFLGGIFEEFTFPPFYWPVLLVLMGLSAGTLVITGFSRPLKRRSKQQGADFADV